MRLWMVAGRDYRGWKLRHALPLMAVRFLLDLPHYLGLHRVHSWLVSAHYKSIGEDDE